MDITRLIEYFRLHPDYPRDIHMLVTDACAAKLLHLMLTECTHAAIHVYCQSEQHLSCVKNAISQVERPQKTNSVILCTMDELEKHSSMELVLFDEKTDRSLLLSLADRKPLALVGMMRGTNVSYLQFFDAYRTSCQNIYIRFQLTNGKIEILNWTKGESGIELSVIFPVYNVGKYLDQCIQSISAWKAPYVEYLFVNDGSPDNSRDIILRYAEKDPRIKLIDKPNGGCASARHKGMEQARGRYIGFIDPDDFIDPDMFRQLLSRALLGNYELCYCGYNEYYESDGSTRRVEDALDDPYARGTVDKNEIQRLILYQRIAVWRGIYLREMLDRANITFDTSLRRFDDLPFKVEVCAQARSAVAIKQYLYYYRLNRPGQDVSCNDERLYVHFDIFRHLDEVFDRLDDRKLKDYLQMCKVQTHAYAIQKIDEKYIEEYCRQAKADLSRNCGILRTLICLRRWLGSGEKVYLSIMHSRGKAYKKSLSKRTK